MHVPVCTGTSSYIGALRSTVCTEREVAESSESSQRAPKDRLTTAESRALSDGAALPPLATRRAPRGTRLGTAVKLRCVHRSRRSTGPDAPGLIYRARGRKTWMDRGPLFRRS